MRTLLKWIAWILIALCAVVAIVWGREIATIASIEQIDGNEYLYAMEFKAPYDLDDVLARDIDSNPALLEYIIGRIGKGIPIKMKSAQVAGEEGELATINCTSFQAAKAEGDGFWYGRNYDYFKNPTMVTVSRPKKGYSSKSI